GSRGAGEQGSRGAGEQGSRGAGEQGSRGAGESSMCLVLSPLPLCPSAPLPLCPSAFQTCEKCGYTFSEWEQNFTQDYGIEITLFGVIIIRRTSCLIHFQEEILKTAK
ncbi:MAG: hypothetical protein V7L23_21060, partial [Nostoc sp.]